MNPMDNFLGVKESKCRRIRIVKESQAVETSCFPACMIGRILPKPSDPQKLQLLHISALGIWSHMFHIGMEDSNDTCIPEGMSVEIIFILMG
jgi:hypothetical protein